MKALSLVSRDFHRICDITRTVARKAVSTAKAGAAALALTAGVITTGISGMSAAIGTPAVVATAGTTAVLGLPQLAQAAPTPFEWEAPGFTIDWVSIGVGIGLLIMGALVVWAGVHVTVNLFKRITKRIGSSA